ncbi:MAG: phage tail protein, partial [Lysobacteraceae bacterium]
MAEPFIGEIKLFGFGFAPRNYVACDGRLLPINQYQALFSLLGARYGGNGVQNFAVPDLRGRTPLHFAPATISIGMR